MTARRTLLIAGAFCAIAVVAFVSGRDALRRNPSAAALDWVPNRGPLEATVLDVDKGIQRFEARVKEDPRDFVSFTILGQLYLRRGRDKGDLTSLRRGEELFIHALTLNADHAAATAALASAYASQHKFTEALDTARALYQRSPTSLDALATMVDAYLETGQYREGEEALKTLAAKVGDVPAVLARRAQMAELRGHNAEAVALLRRALDTTRQHAQPATEIAWFETRLADVLFHSGCLDDSERHFQASLQLFNRYPIGLSGLADVRVAQGKLQEAADLYTKAADESAHPGPLFHLGAVYERLGRAEDAQRTYDRAEQLARRADINQAAFYRELALFYAERPEKFTEALELARKDLAIRKDIEGYDTMAWALYRNQRFDEAASAIGEAMKLGTREPSVYFHAGMIHNALGQADRARDYLQQSLHMSPHMFPEEGRRALTQLGGSAAVTTGCNLQG